MSRDQPEGNIADLQNFSSRPMTMADLKHFDDDPPHSAVFRTPEQQKSYDIFAKAIKNDGFSVDTHVLEILMDKFGDLEFVICANKYPYNVNEDVLHLNVWVNPIFNAEYSKIREHIAKNVSDFVLFRNSPQNRSVPTVEHYQLFINSADADKLDIKELS